MDGSILSATTQNSRLFNRRDLQFRLQQYPIWRLSTQLCYAHDIPTSLLCPLILCCRCRCISPTGLEHGFAVLCNLDEVDAAWGELTRSDPFLLELEALACWQPAMASGPTFSDVGLTSWETFSPVDAVDEAWASGCMTVHGLALAPFGLAADVNSGGMQTALEEPGPLCVVEELARRPWPSLGYLVPAPAQVLALPISTELCWSLPTGCKRDRAMTTEQLAAQLQALEVDDTTTFLCKVFNMLPLSVMGAPPSCVLQPEEDSGVPSRMIPTPSPPRRASARLAKSATAMTQEQRAQARLAKQLSFIDEPKEFNAQVRSHYVDRFKQPLGKLTATLAKAAGVRSRARINLPDEDLRELAGGEAAGMV